MLITKLMVTSFGGHVHPREALKQTYVISYVALKKFFLFLSFNYAFINILSKSVHYKMFNLDRLIYSGPLI